MNNKVTIQVSLSSIKDNKPELLMCEAKDYLEKQQKKRIEHGVYN